MKPRRAGVASELGDDLGSGTSGGKVAPYNSRSNTATKLSRDGRRLKKTKTHPHCIQLKIN